MTAVTIDDKAAVKLIQGLVSKVGKISDRERSYVGLLSSIVFKDLIEHFENETGPEGRWQPWSPRYREWRFRKVSKKAKAGFTPKILQLTGKLRQGWTPTRLRISREGVLWFNPVEYGAKHQEGTDGMPKREFAWLSDKAMESIETQTAKFIEDV